LCFFLNIDFYLFKNRILKKFNFFIALAELAPVAERHQLLDGP